MRHLGSLVLSLLVGAAVYLALGVGGSKLAESYATTGAKHYTSLLVALVAMIVGGGLYALLVLARLSPLGLVTVGLALAGVGLWSMMARGNFVDTMPRELFGMQGVATGAAVVALPLSIPLILTVFSPRRWRR